MVEDEIVWPSPGRWLLPEQRDRARRVLRAKYEAGASIRALAEETGRSYGAVHRLLTDSGVAFRRRQRKKSARPR